MKINNRKRSENVSLARKTIKGGGIGLGTIALGLIVFFITQDPLAGINTALNSNTKANLREENEYIILNEKESELYDYAAVVMADNEKVYKYFLEDDFRPAELVIFKDYIKTGCGDASKEMGPFYCANDEKIFLDLSFLDEMVNNYGAKEGDFITSYILSHEYGHHVQKLVGILNKFHSKRNTLSKKDYNTLSVQVELQADYLAGVLAHFQDKWGYLEEGDLNEALKAAWSIGDDKIAKQLGLNPDPSNFTHGTSSERVNSFTHGYKEGNLYQLNYLIRLLEE